MGTRPDTRTGGAMSAHTLCEFAHSFHVRLVLVGDRLYYDAQKGAVPDWLKALFRVNRAQLVWYLRRTD